MGWRDGIRLILAGLAVFAALLTTVVAVGATGLDKRVPPFVIGLLCVVVGIGAIIGALALFNARGTNPLGMKSAEEQLRELEAAGLLVSTEFRARRAFGVEELEDESLHYYVELEDCRVLFLSGQYLYDYDPTGDPAESRRFPCSEFTVRRHRHDGWVVEIVCRGRVLEPELMAAPFPGEDVWGDEIPQDGELIPQDSYDALKARHASVRRR